MSWQPPPPPSSSNPPDLDPPHHDERWCPVNSGGTSKLFSALSVAATASQQQQNPLQENVIESSTVTTHTTTQSAVIDAGSASDTDSGLGVHEVCDVIMPGPPSATTRGRKGGKDTPRSPAVSSSAVVPPPTLIDNADWHIEENVPAEEPLGSVDAPTATTSSALPGAASRIDNSRRAAGGSGVVLQVLRDPSSYEELSIIGNGAYGTVYRARDKANDQIVALKKMRFSLTEDGVPMAILREISLLKQLEKFDHPNIVRLLDICHGQRRDREMSLYLVFEHVHQDLASYLEKCPPPGLGQDRIKDIIWQILSGVDFLHSHRIVHRDLKPQNLLVTKDGNVKLTDFGLARIYEFYTLLTSVVVTLWYRSPEVLMGLSYATPVDIWSCGCIFAELFLRKPLFPGQYEMDQLSKIFDIIGTPSEADWPERAAVTRNNFRVSPSKDWSQVVPEMDPKAKDLISRMLSFNASERITASEALLHPYFSDDGFAPLMMSPASTSTSSSGARSMRTSDQSDRMTDQSFDSSLTFSSHDESGASSFGDMSGTSK